MTFIAVLIDNKNFTRVMNVACFKPVIEIVEHGPIAVRVFDLILDTPVSLRTTRFYPEGRETDMGNGISVLTYKQRP